MFHKIAVVFLFLFIAAATITSMSGDAVTMDESSHLPAGYSYASQMDMRINPEHPPLVKDLAGIPLLFVKGINFPFQSKGWAEEVNGQWGFGADFLYRSGNDPDKMIFLGRLPMTGLLLLLAFFVYKWTKSLFDKKAGLLALFIFSFSPTLLAHGRLVTTDVAAAFGAFTATYFFVKFLKDPSWKNIVFAGIFLGIAELLKYSLILLIPLFFVIFVIYAWAKAYNFKDFTYQFVFYFLRVLVIGIIALFLIWLVYLFHVWNYPKDLQMRDAKFILSSFGVEFLKNMNFKMIDIPLLRPLAHYLLGLLMVLQRASGGNTGYFFGEVSAAGWKGYFPFVYLAKETITFHILTLTALLYGISLLFRKANEGIKERAKRVFKDYIAEFSMIAFILIYWFTSLKSNLNIGVRHLLPVFPFTISLAAIGTAAFVEKPKFQRIKYFLLCLLLVFEAVSVLNVYPYFLPYFNEAIGTENGYKYAVDSNYDWGQDLRRLTTWVEENNIQKVYVDYFGGGNPEYYLKDKYASWNGFTKGEEFPRGNYLAVSATFLQGGTGKPVPGFTQEHGYYDWLKDYQPVARIGYSIFVYKIE